MSGTDKGNGLLLGCHLSYSGGFMGMGRTALSIGANAFAFFARNPRGGAAKPVDPDDVASFLELSGESGGFSLVAHSPYTLNACSADPSVRSFAGDVMRGDLAIMENVPGHFYNFHPGSHVKQGVEAGISLIAGMLNESLFPEQRTVVLLETMSGKGTEIGGRFGELRAVIDRVNLSEKIGVCLDTCHVWDAGYDVADNLDGVLEEFDSVVGLDRLRAVHLNDSMNPLGARKDRHARLGEGKIGLDALVRIVNHPSLRNLPFILETPNDLEGYAAEIRLLRANFG